jgi:LacI family transcriptional regulator
VSQKLREKISRIAAEMNYQPRMAAQILRSNNTGYLGLILNRYQPDAQPENEHFHSGTSWLSNTFLEACAIEGVRHQLEFISKQSPQDTGVSRLIQGGMIDGAVVSGLVGKDSPLAQDLALRTAFPWVSIGEPAPYCVLSATDQGIEQAIQHLAALGHRRIAMTRGDLHCTTHRSAQDGFDRAIKRFDLMTHQSWIGEFAGLFSEKLQRKQIQWVTQLLKQRNRPTAIICGGLGTSAVVSHVAMSLGLQVPRDLSLIATGSRQSAIFQCPIPTVIEADYTAMMREALSMLRAQIEKRPVATPVKSFPPRLVQGHTVARAQP